jgi:hypothetical protein
LKDNIRGPNRVSGFWELGDKVACQHNPRNHEKEKSERWVLIINRRIHEIEFKGEVKLQGKSRKTFDLAKRGNFRNRKIIREEE